jgi:hypothetical protein
MLRSLDKIVIVNISNNTSNSVRDTMSLLRKEFYLRLFLLDLLHRPFVAYTRLDCPTILGVTIEVYLLR